ncbi:MAG: SRPBCC family protein [Bacteroidota bacterium]
MIRKALKYFLVLLLLAFVCALLFSPYQKHDGMEYSAIQEEIVINAPVDTVFSYIGNSDNAATWSVYVDHITPVNPDKFPDGKAGCVRRCFTRADEKGTTWDEKIQLVEKNKRRRLSIFNMQDFTVAADHLLTEQHYAVLGEKQTKLTFTLFFEQGKGSFWDELKLKLAAWKAADIFRQNLANIKKDIEKS